jgi:hypothetical protein
LILEVEKKIVEVEASETVGLQMIVFAGLSRFRQNEVAQKIPMDISIILLYL